MNFEEFADCIATCSSNIAKVAAQCSWRTVDGLAARAFQVPKWAWALAALLQRVAEAAPAAATWRINNIYIAAQAAGRRPRGAIYTWYIYMYTVLYTCYNVIM